MSSQKEFIDLIVDEFYRVATTDILIGHHFRKIAIKEAVPGHPLRPPLEAFAHHLPRIKSFWYIQLLGEPRAQEQAPFDLIELHRNMSIRMGELNRWLLLFREILRSQSQEVSNPALIDLAKNWEEKLKIFEDKFKKSIFKDYNR